MVRGLTDGKTTITNTIWLEHCYEKWLCYNIRLYKTAVQQVYIMINNLKNLDYP